MDKISQSSSSSVLVLKDKKKCIGSNKLVILLTCRFIS